MNAKQKTLALNKVRFLKKLKIPSKMTIFCRFEKKKVFFGGFSWFFRNRTLLGAVVICVAFCASRRFFWAIKNCFWTTFHIFHHKGGSKSYQTWKKWSKKISKKNSNPDAKWNKKMGGRSFVITCGVIGTLQGSGPYNVTLIFLSSFFYVLLSLPSFVDTACPFPYPDYFLLPFLFYFIFFWTSVILNGKFGKLLDCPNIIHTQADPS